MTCRSCGAPLAPDELVCPHCNAAVSEERLQAAVRSVIADYMPTTGGVAAAVRAKLAERARSQEISRAVEVRLLLPRPTINDIPLDELLGRESVRGLRRAHFMFILLAATDVAIEPAEWTDFCLPQRSGPRRMFGSELPRHDKQDLRRLCKVAGLEFSERPWRLIGNVDIDTRTIQSLTLELQNALERHELQHAVELLHRLREVAPGLRGKEPPRSSALGVLIENVANQVPVGFPSAEADEFTRHALSVTGLGRLLDAMSAAKCHLPARLFDLLLEEHRLSEAQDVLQWIDPSFSANHRLHRRFLEAAEATAGRRFTPVRTRTWVGIEGGPTATVIGGIMNVGPFDGTAPGLNAAASDEALRQSADQVMARLQQIVGTNECEVVVGYPGYDSDRLRLLLRTLADAHASHQLRGDLWVGNYRDLLLFAPPLLGNGVAVIADVSSAVVGWRPDGGTIRRGGEEWLLSDAGSAYDIAVLALRETMELVDRYPLGQPLHPDASALARAARLTFGVRSVRNLESESLEVMRSVARDQALHWDKTAIASFAHPVLRLAAFGNGIAVAVVRSSAKRLGRQLADVLAWHPDPSPMIAIVGFLAMESDLYFDSLIQSARAQLLASQMLAHEADLKLAGVRQGATEFSLDARLENSAGLLVGLARLLSTPMSDLTPSEARVVNHLQGGSGIVERIRAS